MFPIIKQASESVSQERINTKVFSAIRSIKSFTQNLQLLIMSLTVADGPGGTSGEEIEYSWVMMILPSIKAMPVSGITTSS